MDFSTKPEPVFQLVLISPAKINGTVEPVGSEVTVCAAMRTQLAESGAIAQPENDTPDPGEGGVLSDEPQAHTEALVAEMVTEAVEELTREKEEADTRANGFAQQAEDLGRKLADALRRAEMAESRAKELQARIYASAEPEATGGTDADDAGIKKGAKPSTKAKAK